MPQICKAYGALEKPLSMFGRIVQFFIRRQKMNNLNLCDRLNNIISKFTTVSDFTKRIGDDSFLIALIIYEI